MANFEPHGEIDGWWDTATIRRQATEITRLTDEAKRLAEKLEQANQKIHDLEGDIRWHDKVQDLQQKKVNRLEEEIREMEGS